MSIGPLPVREGDLLAGKYRVERVLGAGGMGIVVAARHERLDQLVAIKFVRDDALANEEAVQRFLREARAAVKLKSEHVARVLDVGTLDSGAPYMVMEYLEGSDLGFVIDNNGAMGVESACDFIMQACEAVAEAHATGIVHRDLKPENLFLARTIGGLTRIKVLDFGVSKATQGSSVSGLTQTRAMLGSPLYMSPEQMRSSRDVDARADVWALGVVLFQLLTARLPFEAETMPELCLKVVTDRPLSLASLRPTTPPLLVAVVERCLEKDRERRYANAAELASALEPFAQVSSRILAERARLAIATGSGMSNPPANVTGSQTALNGPSPSGRLPPATPTLQSGPFPAITPATTAGWGSQEPSKPPAAVAVAPRPRPSWIPLAAGVGVVAVVAAAVLGMRSGHHEVATADSAPATPPPPATGLPAPVSPPAAALAPPAATVVAETPAPAIPPPAPTTTASVMAAIPPRPAANAPAARPPKPAIAPPKAGPGDDDIPAIR